MTDEAEISKEADKESARDVLIISDRISRDLHKRLSDELADSALSQRALVFLTTNGGDPHAGYRIARCLRHHYRDVRIVVSGPCKSAGTLITICADSLAIGDLGELGPLDIQLTKASELYERSSGLDIIQALESSLNHAQQAFRRTLLDVKLGARLSTRLAGEFASSIATGLAQPLYNQIDPIRLGEMQRAMRIAHEYGARLNRYKKNLKDDALDRLIAKYPSHEFVIDRKEASELFKRVECLSEYEQQIAQIFDDVLEEESEFLCVKLVSEVTNDQPADVPEPQEPHATREGTSDGAEQEEGRAEGDEQRALDNVSAANGGGLNVRETRLELAMRASL